MNGDKTFIKDYAPETLNYRVYVSVRATFNAEGIIMPEIIFWEDGRWFKIDRVTQRRPAASLKTGGCGLRYTCRIGNAETFLFLDGENRWYVERKRPGRVK